MNSRSRKIIFLLFLVSAVLGCGKSSSDRPLTILIPVGANTLDPHFATSTIEWSILMNVFDPLVVRKDDMKIGPGLAQSWEVDRSLKVWTFHLQKGVKFHNGEDFNARSVKYTFDRMRDKSVRARTTISRRIFLDRVEVVDENTVKFHTKMPVATLPYWLANAFMLPPKHYSTTPLKTLIRNPVGTGPYRLTEWVKDDRIRMEVNENWWKGSPKVKAALWRPVPEGSARIAELETGGADIVMNIPPDQKMLFSDKRSGPFSIKSISGGRRVFMGIRTDHGPLRDVRVRRALNYAVDFGIISKQFLRGQGSRLRSVVNPPNNDPALGSYPFDLEKAKSLLDEAGLRDTNGDGVREVDGKPFALKVNVPLNRYLKGKEISEAVASNLRKIGIDMEIIPLEWSVFLAKRRKKELEALYYHGFSSAFEPELDLGVLRPTLFANLTAWKNPEFIEGYNRMRYTFDPSERKALSFRLQRIIHEEAPWVFLWAQEDFYGLHDRIRWIPRPDERIYLPSVEFKETK